MAAALAHGAGNQWNVSNKIELHHYQRLSHMNSNYAPTQLDGSINHIIATQPSSRSCGLPWKPSSGCLTFRSKDSKLRDVGKLSQKLNFTRTRTERVRGMSCSSSLTNTSPSSNALCTTTYNNTEPTRMTPPLTRRPEDDEVGVQELTVYEVNELDRGSPVLLSLSKLAVDWYNRFRVQPLGSLGDLVPFSNKIFDGSMKKRLGITAGMISVIRHYPDEDALLFEAVYSFYFGDFGHISVKGAYKTHEDTVLAVTGGSGIFTGVYGTVQIQNVEYPLVLFYKFELYGIPPLPQALTWDTVPPAKGVRPSRTASMPGFALPNFTN